MSTVAFEYKLKGSGKWKLYGSSSCSVEVARRVFACMTGQFVRDGYLVRERTITNENIVTKVKE